MSILSMKIKFAAVSFIYTIALSSGLAFAEDPTVLPPVQVTGTRINNLGCSGQCLDQFFTQNSGYISNFESEFIEFNDSLGEPMANAPNNPENQNPATCKNDPEARSFHAAGDFAAWRGIYAPNQIRGRGELFTVEYDGGGTEQYRWFGLPSPTAPPDSYIAAIPGSLKCPK